MKVLIVLLFSISSFCFGQASVKDKFSNKDRTKFGNIEGRYLSDRILVKFRSGLQKTTYQGASVSNKMITLKSAKVESIKQKFSEANVYNTSAVEKKDTLGLDRIFEIKLSGVDNLKKVINEILTDNRVQYAEPIYLQTVKYSPNDPNYILGGQSYLNQVKADLAWDIARSSKDIIVGVVDMGSDFTHPDLGPNIFINEADPINGVDDDFDGYIDNYSGWDFVGASANAMIGDNDPSAKSDSSDHGIHVSGIISAVSDNNIGVASIAFNAKLLIVKVSADNNNRDIFAGYEGIKYAVDHGAKIINCSWGGPVDSFFGRDIVNYAISKGCLIIAAVGNDNSPRIDFPAAYPGVLGIANINGADQKNSSSNYGGKVAISAPGTNILSTAFQSYKHLSGTSMSTPVVSSAAALIASRFPELTMAQVGEKLRVTSDNIDMDNPNYKDQLGAGRLNVYRALTEKLPSIRNRKLTFSKDEIIAGDTVQVYLDLQNILETTSDLRIVLSSKSLYAEVLGSEKLVGTIEAMKTRSQIGPFKIVVKNFTPQNTIIELRLNYYSNEDKYRDFEMLTFTVSPDYINISVNEISTTMSSDGRVGYSSANRDKGLGFIYKGKSLLYEAALIVGKSPLKISDNAYINDIEFSKHFKSLTFARRIRDSEASFEGFAEFDDSNNPSPLNINIKNRVLAYSEVNYSKFIVSEYEVINKSNYEIENLYVGLYTDWDISSQGNNDITKLDHISGIKYAFPKDGYGPYTGVKILNNTSQITHYSLSQGEGILKDEEFSSSDKFRTITSDMNINYGEYGAFGMDIMFVSAIGPFYISPNSSVKIAFALIAGDSLDDLRASALAAQKRYLVKTSLPQQITLQLKQNFPNPVRETTTIEFLLESKGLVSLDIYNIHGQRVKSLLNMTLERGLHSINTNLHELASGIYFYRLRQNNIEKTLRLAIVR